MKKIYSAANLIEAQLMLDLLGHAGIKARLFNENAQGGVGEIPFTHAYPEIWVENDRDVEHGKVVISNYEQTPVETGSVVCHHCAEKNPQNFQLCWHCGAELYFLWFYKLPGKKIRTQLLPGQSAQLTLSQLQ